VKVSEFVPALIPLTFHWKDGVKPPCVGLAVNVTELPAQNGFEVAVTDTLTARIGLTDTGYWMLDAGLFVVQDSEDVRTHDTRSPSNGI
jgi:hypothetical protein